MSILKAHLAPTDDPLLVRHGERPDWDAMTAPRPTVTPAPVVEPPAVTIDRPVTFDPALIWSLDHDYQGPPATPVAPRPPVRYLTVDHWTRVEKALIAWEADGRGIPVATVAAEHAARPPEPRPGATVAPVATTADGGDDLIAWLAAQTWSSFAQSLADQARRGRTLTDKQLAAARSMRAKATGRKPRAGSAS